MYKKFRFRANELAGDVFYSPGTSPRASGLFLYGLPAFVGQNEVTYAMVESGLVAFQPHYFGTYDSGSDYSPRSAIRTCIESQAIIGSGSVMPVGKKDAFGLPPLKVCVGHSFGTLVALRAARSLTTLTKLVLLAPTVHYRKASPNYGNKADGHAILDSIAAGNPLTYRLAPRDVWKELMDGNDPLPPAEAHPTLREVIAVAGTDDPYLDMSALENSLHQVVRAYCGDQTSFQLVTVPGAGHTLSDLVEPGEMFSLRQVCAEL
jgi:hypothetical protein